MKVTELGCAGHLVVSSKCRWHRHTQIGTQYRVSTVGDYVPEKNGKREPIGFGDQFYETMVFRTTAEPDEGSENCGCLTVTSWSEIDSNRYATAGEAQAGHEATIRRFKKKAVA